MTVILLGIAASLFTELVTWINTNILGKSVLKGQGAFLVAAFIAVLFAIGQAAFGASETFATFISHVAQIWASSTTWFLLIFQTLGLDVPSVPKAGS